MDIVIAWLLFALGILLVVKGGDFFVDGAGNLARTLHIPPFIIGATIVSLATTLPELIVSLIAAAKGKTDMAVGNAVGSVTVNTAMIMALAMIAMTVLCPRKKYLKQILLLVTAASVLMVSCLTGRLHWVGCLLLALIFLLFMGQNLIDGKKETETAEEKQPLNKKELAKNILLFVVGAAAIVGGSQLMVNYGEKLAVWMGVPERIIAVTLIAIGTSLPELVTTITAIIKKESSLSVGNIIGANIIDLTLILPLCAVVSGQALPVAEQSLWVDLPACLLVTLIAMIPLIFRQKAAKWQGGILLAAYAGYLALTLFL